VCVLVRCAADCGGGHRVCNTRTRTCACEAAWGGATCDIPVLAPPATDPCVGAVVDLRGRCCRTGIDVTTGLCCAG
jgi:hypothetical protein